MRVEFDWRLDVVRQALRKLAGKIDDMTPILRDIGDALVRTTLQRFVVSKDPRGNPWAPNAPSTIKHYVYAMRGFHTRRPGEKIPKISPAEIVAASIHKRPLIGETKSLSTKIFYEIEGTRLVRVGSPLDYAAVHQFGRGDKPPRIPARPFLGLSDEDTDLIVRIVETHLGDAAR